MSDFDTANLRRASMEFLARREHSVHELRQKLLKKFSDATESVVNVALDQLEKVREALSTDAWKRARYIIEEIGRVTEACQALAGKDLPRLGSLLYATHKGLQHEFEVSCRELDFLVDFTRGHHQVLGARMMGGGFGGCTLNLIRTDFQPEFSDAVTKAYEQEFGMAPKIYRVKTANGSSEISASQLVHG